MEDLDHEARAMGLKLPKVDPVPQESKSPDVKKSKRGRKIVSAPNPVAVSSGPDPHMKKVIFCLLSEQFFLIICLRYESSIYFYCNSCFRKRKLLLKIGLEKADS